MRRYRTTALTVRAAAFLFVLAGAGLPLGSYIGPGAGFAFLSSFLVLFLTFFLALFSFLSWPFRLTARLLKGQKAYKKSKINKLVIVGLDGMEPTLVEKYMAKGILPHLSQLKKQGSYSPLETTTPPISPVAWSSFMTGCHPAKHNIFDFLSRDPNTYLPDLSSARIGSPKRTLSLGKYKIPLSKPEIKGMRKSVPFWKILGENGIYSAVLKIPITFPPEKFKGHLLSGMCAPDLKGSQGMFSYYTSDPEDDVSREGGMIIPVTPNGREIKTYISGPENTLLKQPEELKIPLKIILDKNRDQAVLEVDSKKINLKKDTFSGWVKLTFKPGLGIKIKSICRFYLAGLEPHFRMYMTPLNIDPEKPALPISHPFIYSVYLGKLLGSYTTLGEADDTWALNEGILTEDSFIKLTYDTHRETEAMLFNALKKTKRGVIACWFQATDSLQHMFFRYLDKNHPALKHGQTEKSEEVLENLYKNMDDLVGRVMKKMDKKSVLMVMSDHGFKLFRRGVNLNSWLYLNGYLHLKEDRKTSGEWFKDVDWTKTKAYGLGLAGLYINQKGRESQGTVMPGEETLSLKKELISKLSGLRDEQEKNIAVNTLFDKDVIPPGPYKENCPDLIVGYNEGYRVSWDSVTGKVNGTLFEDNIKAWSGDHCIDPRIVPGIIFTNVPLANAKPSIIDIAPTALKLFGVTPPPHMDGRVIIDTELFGVKAETTSKERES